MPLVECGVQPSGPFSALRLATIGPTFSVQIGFDPNFFAQMVPASGSSTSGASTSPPSQPSQPQPSAPPSSPTTTPSSGPGIVPVGPQLPIMPAIPLPLPAAILASFPVVPALIDTGAGDSCVDEALAQQLQLPLINQRQQGGVHGQGLLNVYLACLIVPQLGRIQAGSFVGARMTWSGRPSFHRAIIGRIFLNGMLMVYNGRTGSVTIAV